MNNNNKLKAIDLFSGAGGLSNGFLQTNKIMIVAAIENNKNAKKTYQRNHPNIKIYNDIKNVNYRRLLNECKNQKINIVFGGPPCQGFSNANRQKTELISTNNQLVKEYVRAIELLKPDAFVLENVKMMKSPTHKFFFVDGEEKEIIDELNITLKTEKISIGKRTNLSKNLIGFLTKKNTKNLNSFIISDEILFSKLRHLSRKRKEFEKYVHKYKKDFEKFFVQWDKYHYNYWNKKYENMWIEIKQDLEKIYSGTDISKTSLSENIIEVVEIQKIILKIDEIIKSNITMGKLTYDEKSVYVLMKTYTVLEYLEKKFKKLGYNINTGVLNAADFGVPQIRERLFIIGISKKKINSNQKVELPSPIVNNYYTVKDAIGDIEEIEPEKYINKNCFIKSFSIYFGNPLSAYLNGQTTKLYNHIITNSTKRALARFKVLNQGENFHHLSEELKSTYSDPKRTQNSVYLRLNYSTPSGTVLNVRKSMWVHPTINRALSIREAARLQTFTDNFVFEGTKDEQYQQVGNAVPPLLGRAVAEKVLEYLGVSIDNKLIDLISSELKIESIV